MWDSWNILWPGKAMDAGFMTPPGLNPPVTQQHSRPPCGFCSAPSRQAGTWNMVSIPCSSTFHRLSLYAEAVNFIFKIHTVFLKGCSILTGKAFIATPNNQEQECSGFSSLGLFSLVFFFPLLTDWIEAEGAYTEAVGCVGAFLVSQT